MTNDELLAYAARPCHNMRGRIWPDRLSRGIVGLLGRIRRHSAFTRRRLLEGQRMSAPFIVFYRYRGEDYNAVFSTMRKAKAFARVTGGRVESRLINLLGV